MYTLRAPLATRASLSSTLAAHTADRAPAQDYPAGWVSLMLGASVCTLPVLAFVNARGLSVSASGVALAEALIFGLCMAVLLQRLSPWTLAMGLGVMGWIVLTWLIRQRPDLKSMRDLLIPLLFISLGHRVADLAFAQRMLRAVTWLVVLVALFESFFPATYGEVFNAFSFYAKLGSIRESSAMFDGQTLALNGYRPEGIGRTLLPDILGSHRTSSIFLEPVSLGNFAVILLAWYLSPPWRALRAPALMGVAAALLLIVLSDSRFGMVMVLLLLAYRMLPLSGLTALALAYPFALLGALLALAWALPSVGDNLLGRISASGSALLRFDEARLLGLDSPLPHFGDMGYAYVLSRFGALLVLFLLATLFLLPAVTERAQRFRGFVVLYFFSSLAISGTSVFALKTAGLMWFLLGVLTASTRWEALHLRAGKP